MADKTIKRAGRNAQIGNNDVIEHDERMVPEYHKGHQIYGEHISRYAVARDLVKDKVVLDIASGSGYGTKELAATARKVYGVDVSENAIAYSKKKYDAKNITYKLGDGESIPLDDQSVEIVTSFETIEHISDYRHFIEESKRVLVDDGIFMVSTPNDKEFTQGNHYHLHQFTEKELYTLLKKHFKYVECYYQTTWYFSLVGDKTSFSEEWERTVTIMQTAPTKPQRVLYFYFLCSDKPMTLPELSIGAIGELWSERQYREKMQLTDNHIANIEDLLTHERVRSSELKAANEQLEETIKALRNTPYWRLRRVAKRLLRR